MLNILLKDNCLTVYIWRLEYTRRLLGCPDRKSVVESSDLMWKTWYVCNEMNITTDIRIKLIKCIKS